VGYDALAIYVQNNPLNEITLDQIAQIYSEDGKLRNGLTSASKSRALPATKSSE
jgi:hypothetical protein